MERFLNPYWPRLDESSVGHIKADQSGLLLQLYPGMAKLEDG